MNASLQPNRLKLLLKLKIPQWILCLLLLSFAGGVIIAVACNKIPPDPQFQKFEKIKLGMGEKEVEDIFGYSGWDNGKIPLDEYRGDNGEKPHKILFFHHGGRGEAYILFDIRQRVIGKEYHGH